MRIIEKNFNRNYDILITDSFSKLKEEVVKVCNPSSILIITDNNVSELYLTEVQNISKEIAPSFTHIIEAGEKYKNSDTVAKIYDTCIRSKLDRSGLIIALGGGVVGDIAGFVASSFMRGVPFIQVPTTVVAQNDSSIGGKVGVDYLSHKNMIGAFYNPLLVYINTETLSTLPNRELVGGLSEVIKHGLIRDENLFSFLEAHTQTILTKNQQEVQELTYMSCCVKADVVEQDAKEMGLRKILNFGHTIGHAIETLSDFTITHGECVAYGMLMASYMSYKRELITKEELNKIANLCKAYGLLKPIPHFSFEKILEQMSYDKKKSYNKISFILLKRIGEAVIVRDIEESEIKQAIQFAEETCG